MDYTEITREHEARVKHLDFLYGEYWEAYKIKDIKWIRLYDEYHKKELRLVKFEAKLAYRGKALQTEDMTQYKELFRRGAISLKELGVFTLLSETPRRVTIDMFSQLDSNDGRVRALLNEMAEHGLISIMTGEEANFIRYSLDNKLGFTDYMRDYIYIGINTPRVAYLRPKWLAMGQVQINTFLTLKEAKKLPIDSHAMAKDIEPDNPYLESEFIWRQSLLDLFTWWTMTWSADKLSANKCKTRLNRHIVSLPLIIQRRLTNCQARTPMEILIDNLSNS